jgi:lipid-binding SYLF domain-containing protein
MMAKRLLGITTLATLLAACSASPYPGDFSERDIMHSRVNAAIADFKHNDPSIQNLFEKAEAYVVFPRVVTGAVVFGGAKGRGEVYERGRLVGYAVVTQGSFGAQLGGQEYAEVIFFQNESAFVDFKSGSHEVDARATAIAASNGAAATADYRRGVIVFTLPEGGLMAQASVGVQKFGFQPLDRLP